MMRTVYTIRGVCDPFRRAHRGAVLMELVVAMAIFVATAMFTLSVVDNSYASLERARQQQLAVDLARSTIGELEAGLLSIGDVQSELIERVGSIDLYDALAINEQPEWFREVNTEPTEFTGLTLVEVIVTIGIEEDAPRATLRQLIALREQRADDYEQDEMLDGLESSR